ncbi:PEGA domain-containing protein [Methanofollis ethanolicus]|uniref:PEGA domain-containing protein n=1 Tax=Methanofollis ethanolicus TaxID=488124 RepID=UPI00082A987D|nr:PEGA domain-containing protein [Methanofollis ethanolicus]
MEHRRASISVDGIFSGWTNAEIPDLLAGSHTVEVTKNGYRPASRTVQVSEGQTTEVSFDLTAETGTLQVTSSPPGARVFIDGAEYGTTSETTGSLTLSNVRVGSRQVKVLKDGYAPFTATVTIEKDRTTSLTATLNNDDLEGDGLLDHDETNGFLDGFGNRHTTDPDLLDTDGDGLSDGYEAGPSIIIDGKTYHKQRSDPTKADTDGDGLDDWDEDYLGTDPLNRDTDFDSIIDGVDDAPLTPVYISVPLNKLIEKRNATLGSVFGETGITGGSMNWIVGDDVASSPAYFIGWMASGYFAVGDLRDTLEALYQGDTVGAGLNALGIVPLAGDGERSANALRKVVTKYPGRAADLGRYLLKQDVVQRIPSESLQLFVLDHCFEGGATALRGLNVPMARILEVGKIDGIHLARHADALEIVRGSSRVPDRDGDVAEIIAEETILKTLYPSSAYSFYSDVELKNVYGRKLGEIDTVVVREDHVVAIVQTKMGRTVAAAKDAKRQINDNIRVIDDRFRFYTTNKPDLTPAKFRFVELDTITVGPKDSSEFDHVVDYTNRELHEIYKTIRG